MSKWTKIAIHYGVTFVVGGLFAWLFKWSVLEWLIYFAFCDLWYILRETEDSND